MLSRHLLLSVLASTFAHEANSSQNGREKETPTHSKQNQKTQLLYNKGPRGRVIWGRQERTIRLGPVRLLPAPNNPFLFPDSTRPRCV